MTNSTFFWPEQDSEVRHVMSGGKRRHATKLDCDACGLHKTCNSPRMPMTGKGKKGIFILGEVPNSVDDRKGKTFSGHVGKFLRSLTLKYGVDLDNDCWRMNSLGCHPPVNHDPTNMEIACCRGKILKAIRDTKPRLIIPMGTYAVECLYGHRWKKDLESITRWRGYSIPDRDLHAWVCPIYDPYYVTDDETSDAAEVIFRKDLKRALLLDRAFPKTTPEEDYVTILDKGDSIAYLKDLLKRKPNLIAIDYETTGLKPHRKGHEIVTCAIAESPKEAYSWWMTPEHRKYLIAIWLEKHIGKIASNMKFEDLWTRVILGVKPRGWKWDTMVAEHVITNRRSATSIKWQALAYYGRVDYDSAAHPFLKSLTEKDGNSFNQIHKAPRKTLLLYNGVDTIFEFRRAIDQMEFLHAS